MHFEKFLLFEGTLSFSAYQQRVTRLSQTKKAAVVGQLKMINLNQLDTA